MLSFLSTVFAGVLIGISISLLFSGLKILFMSKEEFEYNKRKYE